MYAALGHSLRSGIGVSLEAHLRYLTAAGLSVERSFDVDGEGEEDEEEETGGERLDDTAVGKASAPRAVGKRGGPPGGARRLSAQTGAFSSASRGAPVGSCSRSGSMDASEALTEAAWIGHDPSYDAPPLSRPDHPFNGHYRSVASIFLSASLGRLLNVPGEVNAAGAALQEVQGEA